MLIRRFEDLIGPEEIEVVSGAEGSEVTERFVISTIPGFYAMKLHAKAGQMIRDGKVDRMPDEVVLELLKYAAKGAQVLSDEKTIDCLCRDDEVVLAVALAVWKRNFGFLRTRQFPRLHGGSGETAGLVGYTGIDPLIGFIVHRGHATLWETKHVYSYEELYDIWEADAVPEDNTSTIQRRAMDQAKLKKGVYQ